jgi:hypothetical protein
MDDATVGAGGALGAALFAEQLAFRKQKFVLKIGSDLSFADLKNSPAILLGGSRWTKELTRDLRYRMIDPDRWKIVDTKDPTKMWTVPAGSRDERSEGYSLITRLIRSDSDHPVLLVVGIDVRNTMAAVEFLSNPEKFELFASKAAAGWENKSFQVVLRNTIHGNSSGALSIAAMHVW